MAATKVVEALLLTLTGRPPGGKLHNDAARPYHSKGDRQS